MTSFDQAIAIVHDALNVLRENAGALPRASRASLEGLLTAKTAPSPIQAPAPVSTKPLPPTEAPAPSGSKTERLAVLRQQMLPCEKCPYGTANRSHIVFGAGNPEAKLLFVGEAPGEDEDLQGEPFVGDSGQLLAKIIEVMGYHRSDVYITNVFKCRPDMPPGKSGNRKPRAEEMAACMPNLIQQIEIIQPECIVALGGTAMEGLLEEPVVIGEVRGHWHAFRGIPVMATYHPAYLLHKQSLSEKRKVWEDMLQVLEKLKRPISAKQRGFFLPK